MGIPNVIPPASLKGLGSAYQGDRALHTEGDNQKSEGRPDISSKLKLMPRDQTFCDGA